VSCSSSSFENCVSQKQRQSSARPAAASEPADRATPVSLSRQDWLLMLLLVAATFLSYYPAWNGQPLWDDDAHITRAELRSFRGLVSIWTELGVTQQYYPLMHSVFWVEHKLWGDATLGYHLVNILLHALSALLFLRILQRLQIPGAWLAAGIFALHPVHVESVAWITELKNTLSGFFYLGSMLAYLRFDQARDKRFCGAALGLFALGLMCKTVIASLPAALLVIFWWKRGRLRWKTDFLPLLPFFLVGLASGLFTAWVERKLIGAQGAEFNFTLLERCLIAGRATWFYLDKLFWPAPLAFSYPRWQVSQAIWWQYLFPIVALVLLGVSWALRRRSRASLAALLFFVGTLFPALGFLNVYPFRYSFVADHFQYLASLSIIALFSAGTALLLARLGLWGRPLGVAFGLALLAALASLTCRQCLIYSDPETLWRDTGRKNPGSWQAHDQLGCILERRGRYRQSAYHFSMHARMRPRDPGAYSNWGIVLRRQGKLDDAIAKLETALRLDPNHFKAHFHLGQIFDERNQWSHSAEHLLQAARLQPDDRSARFNLASVQIKLGRLDEAVVELKQLLREQPQNSLAQLQLALAFLRTARLREAAAVLFEAIRSDAALAASHYQLWTAVCQHPDLASAPDYWHEVLDLKYHSSELFNNLAWVLATHPDPALRSGPLAVKLAESACRLNRAPDPHLLDTLAAAYAAAGRFTNAVSTLQKAIALADTAKDTNSLPGFRSRLELYRAQQPYHER